MKAAEPGKVTPYSVSRVCWLFWDLQTGRPVNSKHSTQVFGFPQAPSFLSLGLTLPSWQALPVSGKVSLWWKNGHCSSLLLVPTHIRSLVSKFPFRTARLFLLKKPERRRHFLPGYPGSHPPFPAAFRPARPSDSLLFCDPQPHTYDLTARHLFPHILPVPRHTYLGSQVKRQKAEFCHQHPHLFRQASPCWQMTDASLWAGGSLP